MNDQKADANMGDDEYRFEDFDKFEVSDESVPSADSDKTELGSGESEPFQTKKDHRKMVIICIVLVIMLGFGVNSLVSRLGGVKIPKETPPLPKAEAPIQPAMPQQSPTPVVATPPPVPTATASDIDRLNDVIVAQQQSMNQMQMSINSLQESVNSLNSALGDVSQKMVDVLAKMPTKPVARPKPIPSVAAEPARPMYTIRAMVPGRAWLQSDQGQTITVIDGDTVPGYGMVQDIDVNGGQVVLADGTIIGYNFNS